MLVENISMIWPTIASGICRRRSVAANSERADFARTHFDAALELGRGSVRR